MKEYKIKKRLKYFYLTRIYKKPNKESILSLVEKLKPVATDRELIRLGGKGDGGYLVPNDLEELKFCFSPGVGTSCSFEEDCANLGMEVFMADGSVAQPPVWNKKFHFQQKFLGNSSNKGTITLKEWVSSVSLSNEDLMLQMDIEGNEYDVINNCTPELLKRFRILVVEFHGLELMGKPYFFQRIKRSFEKLLVDHLCVHIHPNNCCGLHQVFGVGIPGVAEFTFLRKDRIKTVEKVKSLPHILDSGNMQMADIRLPKIWYS